MLAIAAEMAGPPSEALTVARMLAFGEAAENAIAALGHAKPGDKTILDALDPAVRSLRRARSSDQSVAGALGAAALAARAGAEATAQMRASVGRASRLGERSRGLADPGASSLAVIIDAIAAAYSREAGGDTV
jgi:dihydroxyacetone kinase